MPSFPLLLLSLKPAGRPAQLTVSQITRVTTCWAGHLREGFGEPNFLSGWDLAKRRKRHSFLRFLQAVKSLCCVCGSYKGSCTNYRVAFNQFNFREKNSTSCRFPKSLCFALFIRWNIISGICEIEKIPAPLPFVLVEVWFIFNLIPFNFSLFLIPVERLGDPAGELQRGRGWDVGGGSCDAKVHESQLWSTAKQKEVWSEGAGERAGRRK